jgi:polyhydroxyalkanoate synthesis regulator phasin
MPAPRSSGGSGASARKSSGSSKRAAPGRPKRSAPKRTTTQARSRADVAGTSDPVRAGAPTLAEQLLNAVIRPLGLVLLTRDRIQEVLDDAAERGRVTRADANELVLELVKRGRQQTDELLKEIEHQLGRGRDQIGSATRRVRGSQPVERIVRGADRARRSVGVGPSLPILGYDDLTARQVEQRLSDLKAADLRNVRDYERRHANRKTVLDAIERALG